MRRYPNRAKIPPKLSTMPRQQTEAAILLDMYKLSTERRRLQQELENLELRKQQIGDRLNQLDHQVAQLDTTLNTLRNAPPSQSSPAPKPATAAVQHSSSAPFNTLFLEY